MSLNDLSRKTSVTVGTQTLSTNVYENDRNGLLSEVQYGNGGKVKYTYDDFDRITGVKYDNESSNRYTYGYGSNGQAAEVKDTNLSRITRTEFDLSDRPCKVEVTDLNDNLIYRTQLKYDKRSNLHSFSEKLPSETHTTTYTYDNDNRITNIAYDGTANNVAYTYDSLGRVNTRAANSYTTTFGYVAGGHGTKSTTPLVASITQPGMNFSYTYDNRGNITSETRNGSTTTYVYDGLGQLTRVNDPHENATWVYNYDRGGNIASKVKYAYTTGTLGTAQQTVTYSYDSVWKDKMIAFSDRTLTYDAIGNLTNYAGWVYEWQNGRQLKKQTQNETVVTYDYDHNGMRTRKTVGNTSGSVSEVYNYTYSGTKLVHLTRNSDALHFFYDANGKPAFVKFNGTTYRYVHNLQGDIVGIVDSNNTFVVEYKYTTWGMILSRSGSMSATLGYLNPFRYRSYIYDEETWMYWVKSRYYYPELHRFINVDLLLGNIGSVLAHNVWTYCYNKPTVFSDHDGQRPSFPKDSYRFDWAGVKILWWYLFGVGKKREITGGAWSNYMKKAKTCANDCCGSKKSSTLSEYTYSLLKPHADGIQEGEVRTVELQERVSLQNGESIFGYNFLHGVNGDVGGYVVSATITRYCGYITYNVTCTWNDVMDPNFSYESDKIKAEFAKSIPGANPADYTISITWNDTFVENVGGVSVPQY